MRQSLAGISNCPAALSVALLAAVMAPASPDVALSDASGSGTLTSTAPPAPACGSNELELHEPSPDSEPGCATAPRTPEEIAEARAYLIETAGPGLHHDATRRRTRDRTSASRIRRSPRECNSGSAERRAAVRRSFLSLSTARIRSWRFLRQIQLAAYLRTRRRHAWHRGSWLPRSTVVAPDRCQERCRLSLWSAQPRRMESLPADERQDHLGPEPLARDGELRGPIRP